MSGIWPATHQQDPSGVRSFHFVMMKSPFLIHVSWSNPISQPFIMVKSCQIPIFHGENAHNLDSSPLLLVKSWCFAHHSEPRHGPSRAPAGRRHDPKRLPYRWWATATCGAQWRWKSRGGFPVVMGVPPIIPVIRLFKYWNPWLLLGDPPFKNPHIYQIYYPHTTKHDDPSVHRLEGWKTSIFTKTWRCWGRGLS